MLDVPTEIYVSSFYILTLLVTIKFSDMSISIFIRITITLKKKFTYRCLEIVKDRRNIKKAYQVTIKTFELIKTLLIELLSRNKTRSINNSIF